MCEAVLAEQDFNALADQTGLKAQFRRWALTHHPDKANLNTQLYDMVKKCLSPRVVKRMAINRTFYGKMVTFFTTGGLLNTLCMYAAAYIVVPIATLAALYMAKITMKFCWSVLKHVIQMFVAMRKYADGTLSPKLGRRVRKYLGLVGDEEVRESIEESRKISMREEKSRSSSSSRKSRSRRRRSRRVT